MRSARRRRANLPPRAGADAEWVKGQPPWLARCALRVLLAGRRYERAREVRMTTVMDAARAPSARAPRLGSGRGMTTAPLSLGTDGGNEVEWVP